MVDSGDSELITADDGDYCVSWGGDWGMGDEEGKGGWCGTGNTEKFIDGLWGSEGRERRVIKKRKRKRKRYYSFGNY